MERFEVREIVDVLEDGGVHEENMRNKNILSKPSAPEEYAELQMRTAAATSTDVLILAQGES